MATGSAATMDTSLLNGILDIYICTLFSSSEALFHSLTLFFLHIIHPKEAILRFHSLYRRFAASIGSAKPSSL